MDCVDDEWIGNRHVGIGWGCEVVRGYGYWDGILWIAWMMNG